MFLFGRLVSGYRPEVNLIRPVSQPQGPGPGVELTQGEVRVEAAPAMSLRSVAGSQHVIKSVCNV